MLFGATLVVAVALTLAEASPVILTSSSSSSSSNTSSGGFTSQHWKNGIAKAKSIVSQMTYEEKLKFSSLRLPATCSGNTYEIERLGIPSLCFSDSPVGILSRYSSQFPGGVTASATWDRDLIYQRAKAMGTEFHDLGIHTPLAIVVGPMGRSVYGGRNWEGFSSDPYFAGEAVKETVRGMQEQGVTGLVKHFFGNEQEYLRVGNPQGTYLVSDQNYTISSDIDDATAHELYVWPFAEAVREGAGSIMCSYNKLNGTLACENSHALNTILKGELGFEGYVLSDWNAAWNTVPAALGGLDYAEGVNTTQNPWGTNGTRLDAAIQAGELPKDILDDKIIRVLTPYYALNQSSLPEVDFARSVLNPEHDAVIRNVSSHAITLLKNNKTENATFGLPIQEKGLRDIILVGTGATYGRYGSISNEVPSILYFAPDTFYDGQITGGFGSGGVYAPYVSTPVEAITARARKASPPIFVDGFYSNNATEAIEDVGLGPVNFLEGRLSYAGKVFVFVSAVAMESADRTTLELGYGGADLIKFTADRFNDTIVVVNAPGPVEMSSWSSHPNVTAILFAHFPGQEAGNSLADVLFGDVNPSGKLPYTIAKDVADYDHAAYYNETRAPNPVTNFTEGVYIDYKWFDLHNTTPLYEYGFGLSYTTFNYSNIAAKANYKKAAVAVSETNEKFYKDGKPCDGLYDVSHTVTATLKNTGKVDGYEVAQLYLTFPDGTPNKMPIRSLRGFEKPWLKAGASTTVSFDLRQKDLSVWDVTKQAWVLPKGQFTVSVGSSSRKLPLKASFTV